jgi:two-component system heavy metal sensor histidine kinase CusS
VALLAAVLALALAQLAVRAPVEAQALRTLRAYGEGLAAQAERRERFRRELRETRARAEDLAELVVHDLKNPLAVVLSNVSVAFDAIARFPDLSEEREALHVAQVEAIRLSGMIGDLLVVPRLERGELHAQFSATRVWDLLDSVARATGLRAASRGLRLAVVAPPELVAWIDPLLVRRLLENLVGNALRHAPLGGRIELAASVEGERLRLAVRNDGAAVAAELRPRLFEKYAAHGEHDPRCSGLGLYLCRMVAELHGGRVGLVERAGWNVSFEAELPLTGRSERRDQPGATLTSRSA